MAVTMTTLADKLQAVRNQRFVGREDEQALFHEFLDPDGIQQLLFIVGPGGVGKSTLLNQFVRHAGARRIPVIRLDARMIPANPQQITEALGLTGFAEQPMLLEVCSEHELALLILDTFEYWQAMEAWFRDTLLPQLPGNLRVIIAGRQAPATEWRFDAGWHDLMRLCELKTFSAEETARYLHQRNIPAHRAADVFRFSHGYPLALALSADLLEQDANLNFGKQLSHKVVQDLVERFTREATGPLRRQALQACAVALEVNELLLADMLKQDDVSELFAWLSGLSFIDHGTRGVFPHDLVREVLIAEMKWRHPGRYEQLARLAFDFEANCILQHPEMGWREVALHVMRGMFALRHTPAMEGFISAKTGAALYLDRLNDDDVAVIEAMVLHHEGPESLRLFKFWMARQPEGIVVARDAGKLAVGFQLNLDLDRATPQDIAADPFASQVWRLMETRAPFQKQDTVRFCRFWMAADTYQEPSALATCLMTSSMSEVLISPNMKIMCKLVRLPSHWTTFSRTINIEALDSTRQTLGDHDYMVFLSDWRIEPQSLWIQRFGRRATCIEPADRVIAKPAPLQAQMSEADFSAALTNALQHFVETDELRHNQLLQSCLITTRPGGDGSVGSRIQILREVIKETIAGFSQQTKTDVYARILQRTFIEPARSQEIAADALCMGYSTYRRKLGKAKAILIAELWQDEVESRKIG